MNRGNHLLLVDDEALIARGMALFLEDEGLRVSTAGSAEQAIALVESGERFAVCIMDIRLPGMDGAAGIIRLHELDPTLHFLIHTGSSDFSLTERLRGIGIDDSRLFRKPLLDMQPLADMARRLSAPEDG